MDTALIPILLCIALSAAAAGSVIYHTFYNGISPMPTSPRVLREILTLVDTLKPDSEIIELGSGWGTITLPLARRNPDCSVRAFENSPVPWLWTRILGGFFRHKNLTIRRCDFFRESIESSEIIICYLSPSIMKRLRPKLEAELANGAYVISNTFSIPGWRPFQVITVPDLYLSRIYLYRWPVSFIKGAEFYA